jgi:hypothetical protein
VVETVNSDRVLVVKRGKITCIHACLLVCAEATVDNNTA